jgi:hypothetical protein
MKAALRLSDPLTHIGSDEFIAVMVDSDITDDNVPILEILSKTAPEPINSVDTICKYRYCLLFTTVKTLTNS